nr:hypothetical protein Iba_chr09eCG13460 [Ipomoea batatas]GME03022.1 hypothetical protein Iba_scaffold332CG0040 [Ipomoea batatas]
MHFPRALGAKVDQQRSSWPALSQQKGCAEHMQSVNASRHFFHSCREQDGQEMFGANPDCESVLSTSRLHIHLHLTPLYCLCPLIPCFFSRSTRILLSFHCTNLVFDTRAHHIFNGSK